MRGGMPRFLALDERGRGEWSVAGEREVQSRKSRVDVAQANHLKLCG